MDQTLQSLSKHIKIPIKQITYEAFDKVYPKFIELKELYRDAEYGVLPSSYSKLAQIGLDRIPDKYKPDPEKSGN